MNKRIYDLPDAPLPLDPDSYYEVLIPDGTSASGYTSCKIKPGTLDGFKKYFALITQTGTSAPTVIELVNSTGATFTPYYDGVGAYMLEPSSAIFADHDKVGVHISDILDANGKSDAYIDSSDNIFISTYVSGAATNGKLNKTFLMVYLKD